MAFFFGLTSDRAIEDASLRKQEEVMFWRLFPSRSTSRGNPQRPRRRLRLETLEDRRLLAVTAGEQEFVYLLNLARHDPAAYAQEVDLGDDLSYVAPCPPLAVNEQLLAAVLQDR